MNRIGNLKIYKRLLALLTAGVISLSSLPALALETEEETVGNKENVQVVDEEPTQIIITDYFSTVDKMMIKPMEPFIKNNYDIYDKSYTVFYYINHSYCEEIRENLINNHVIPEDLMDGLLATLTVGEAIIHANLNVIKKSTNIDDFLDFSVFAIDPEIRELTHNTFEMYLKVYEQATIDCDEHKLLIEGLKELKEKEYFSCYYCIFNMMRSLYEHCILMNFKTQEISNYYKVSNGSIGGVNKNKYKNITALRKELESKKNRTKLEEYLLLMIKNPAHTFLTEDVEAAIKRINTDYKKYQKTLEKK